MFRCTFEKPSGRGIRSTYGFINPINDLNLHLLHANESLTSSCRRGQLILSVVLHRSISWSIIILECYFGSKFSCLFLLHKSIDVLFTYGSRRL